MTRERAKYILANKLLGGDLRYAFRQPSYHGRLYDDGITQDEHKAVHALWLTLPGHTSFFSALCQVANGKLWLPLTLPIGSASAASPPTRCRSSPSPVGFASSVGRRSSSPTPL